VSAVLQEETGNLEREAEIQGLILLLRETERSLLAFALYRTVAEREAVARELRQRLSLPVQEFTLSTRRRNPFDLIQEIRGDGRVVCFLYDVEEAFPEALGYLNLQRERLAELPHAVVFWVREYGLREIGVKAPDFWAWRSGVFDFRASEERVPWAVVEAAVAQPFTYLDRGDLERRLSLYRGLLRDHSQEEHPDQAFLTGLEIKIGLGCYYLGEWEEARAHWQKALEIGQRAGDDRGQAAALHNLGILAQEQGDYVAARYFYQQSLEIDQALGDRAGASTSLHQLGTLAQEQRDYAAARHFYQQSLETDQALGNRAGVSTSLHQLGMLAQVQGDYAAACGLYQQSLEMAQALGDRAGVSASLHQLGIVAHLQGDYTAARRYCEQSLEIKQSLGDQAGVSKSLHQLGALAQSQGDYAAARHFYQQSLEIKQVLGDRLGVAISQAQMALLEEAEGNVAPALELIRQAEAIFRQLGSPKAEQVRQVRERLEGKSGGASEQRSKDTEREELHIQR
jgi:tetratricopeptide (TPR) repeat protein